MQFTVGLKADGKTDHTTVDADDALSAALKVKMQRPEAQILSCAEEELTLRDYRETDAAALSRLALAGFEEFQSAYSDWAAMSASISQMPSLAAAGELIIAEARGDPLGAVA